MILRPSTERDVAAIRAVYPEPDIRYWMGWDDHLPDEAEARANVERAATAWSEGTSAVFRIVDPAPDASRRVAERGGFTAESIERASRAWPGGTRFDSILLSLLPDDRA